MSCITELHRITQCCYLRPSTSDLCPSLTPAMNASTSCTYHSGMEGRVDPGSWGQLN